MAGPQKLGRHEKDLGPQCLQRDVMELVWQAQSPKPIHQIVSEEQQVKVGLVGKEMAAGDFPQGVVALELPDAEFDPCPVVVEAPQVEGLQREVGDQDLVVVLAELEERQLVGRLFGLGPSDYAEAIGMRPPGGLVVSFSLPGRDTGDSNGFTLGDCCARIHTGSSRPSVSDTR